MASPLPEQVQGVSISEHRHDTPSKPIDTIIPHTPAPEPPRNIEEIQYLSLVKDIMARGEHRPDRTGTGTYAVFAPPQLRFSLRNGALPLLTTKRVYTKAVIAELLWFISGATNSALLAAQGVKIWDGNGSREYLDKVGLAHREVGDLGPVYGFQWRHFGAEYTDCHEDYTGKGVDQLAEVVYKLMNTPYDRRIILTAWNPKDIKKMALPPCHMFAQFYVSFPRREGGEGEEKEKVKPKGELHCCLYQRSCDMGLGVPFNIASYALLTHILAYVTGLDPGEFIHCMGDAHVYVDHVEALKVQCEREPRRWPTLRINREEKRGSGDVDGFEVGDFEVVGYDPWPAVKMKMSV
ncbi:thymidylate synthase [Peziza echinospora]|nr:thymidylate synthase [Peziza echinospora]